VCVTCGKNLSLFRRVRIKREKRLLDSSCFAPTPSAVYISVRPCQLCLQWKGFCEISYRELLRKSVRELKIWFKLDKNIGQLTARHKYFYTVDNSTKYFVARQSAKKTHSCFSNATYLAATRRREQYKEDILSRFHKKSSYANAS
jgi:hypothetical protein